MVCKYKKKPTFLITPYLFLFPRVIFLDLVQIALAAGLLPNQPVHAQHSCPVDVEGIDRLRDEGHDLLHGAPALYCRTSIIIPTRDGSQSHLDVQTHTPSPLYLSSNTIATNGTHHLWLCFLIFSNPLKAHLFLVFQKTCCQP